MKPKETVFFLGILLFVTGFFGWDIYSDLKEGSSIVHLTGEISSMLLLSFGIGLLTRKLLQAKKENQMYRTEIDQSRKDFEAYKKETSQLTQGLNQKVQEQMKRWHLSAAERDICLLVLKGLANKEISYLRKTSEKTVTQQLGQVYTKSGLQGRSELLAFFLEDLFVVTDTQKENS
jgi:DNA-binding CsgD family transcriptional regulator